MRLPDFSKLFEDGREVAGEWGRVVLRRREAGELVVTSGCVVACDPLTEPDAEPFLMGVANGRYPVSLSVAHFEDGDQRVAGALVSFAPGGAVARWEMALVAGDDPAELEEGEIIGYPVDSGTGCFMDERAARLLAERMEEDENFLETFLDAMERNYVDT